MRKVNVAAIQMSCSRDAEETLKKAERLVRKAAEEGANVILLQELFETPYFCQRERYEYFDLAKSLEDNAAVKLFQKIAKELKVVLPISFFEKAVNTTFNTIAMIDSDGCILGIYRKNHIPDGHCYEEKFYFAPGDTGFKVWDTAYGKIGVGICWDQWFPEAARCMALMGAELLLYPTAIGSEPILNHDSQPHWTRSMQGHAAANIIPVIAANRIGTEYEVDPIYNLESHMTFYGSSFIADESGEIVALADRTSEAIIHWVFDLDQIEKKRSGWGVYRDRRPETYQTILTYGV